MSNWELKHAYLETVPGDAGGAGADGQAPAAPAAGGAPAAEPGAGAQGGDQPTQGGAGEGEGSPVRDAAAPRHWKELLSEDLRGAPALKDIDSVDALATQLVNAQGLIGNSIRIPSENASDEDRAAFRAKLRESAPGLVEMGNDPESFAETMRTFGAPADASGYALPESAAENVRPVEGFNEWAHEANLTQAQFETVATRFTEAQLARQEQAATRHNSEMELLHREWGYAYEERSQLALDMARASGAPQDFINAMENNAVPAAWVKYMADMGKQYGAEADVGRDREAGNAELSPAEAQAQHDEIMANPEHPYWAARPGSPEGERARELVMKLKERAMGKGSREVAASFGYGGE